MVKSAVAGKLGRLSNFIDGKECYGSGSEVALSSPLSATIIGSYRQSTVADLELAVRAAERSQHDWGARTVKERSQVLFAYRELLRTHREELAEICHLENGKTIAEALAGVDKSLELVDFACSLPALISGRIQEVSRGVTCYDEYLPVGVTASITPFNFPIMVPHWTTPLVLALGNSVILKPSELTPATAGKIARLWQQAGLPDGLLNIINGDKVIVEAICDHPVVGAFSFVGSTPVAQQVFRRCSSNLKRVAAFGGAKNHIVLLPDADFDMACNDIVAAFSGMSGQRCMAASTLIVVGDCDSFIAEIVRRSAALRPGIELAPMITASAVDRIQQYLDRVSAAGADLLLDGRRASIPSGGGYYIGASVIDYRNGTSMPSEEVFGPTLEIVRAANIAEAAAIQNASPFGNAAAVFTSSGARAAELLKRFSAGMLGVNIGIPVPRDPFSFGGAKFSHFGYADITGIESLPLWTKHRKITSKWSSKDKVNWMS